MRVCVMCDVVCCVEELSVVEVFLGLLFFYLSLNLMRLQF